MSERGPHPWCTRKPGKDASPISGGGGAGFNPQPSPWEAVRLGKVDFTQPVGSCASWESGLHVSMCAHSSGARVLGPVAAWARHRGRHGMVQGVLTPGTVGVTTLFCLSWSLPGMGQLFPCLLFLSPLLPGKACSLGRGSVQSPGSPAPPPVFPREQLPSFQSYLGVTPHRYRKQLFTNSATPSGGPLASG